MDACGRGEGDQAICMSTQEIKIESTDGIVFFSCKEVGVFSTKISSLDGIKSGKCSAI